MFNDENLVEVENGIQFVGFTGDSVSISVTITALELAEDKEREDRSSVANTEMLTLTEFVREKKVFVESPKLILRDSVSKLDIAKLENLLTRVDKTVGLLISCGTKEVVPSSIEIVAVSLDPGSIAKDIRNDVFALWLLSDGRDSLLVPDESLLFVPLANGDWIIEGVEIVVMAPENCEYVSLALLDTDGEAITTEETRELSLWTSDCITELTTAPGILTWLELLAVVVGCPAET